LAVAFAAAALAVPSQADAARSAVVRDGNARFQVLSPTLIRLEYAADGRFEDRPTMTAVNRRFRVPRFRTRVVGQTRVIRTSRLTLHYRRGSGPFSASNVEVLLDVGGRGVTARPGWKGPPGPPPEPPMAPTRTQAQPNPDPDPRPATRGNLGGWVRGVDDQDGPVPLHEGLLSRAGWYLLDDTRSVLLTRAPPGFATRPERRGAYQDGYFFGYGHDYARGLRALRALSGAAPLLPRKTFGNWFSRYWPYGDRDWRSIVGRFRSEKVPLDLISIDTDFKAPVSRLSAAADAYQGIDTSLPYSWNGWDWNRDLYPDPAGFIGWLHREGVALALNIHPSIGDRDPHWDEAQRRSGGLTPSGLATGSTTCNFFMADPLQRCAVFDWTNPRHLDAYFWLHEQFERQGLDFWWLDWCCDESRAQAPGLAQDTWINHLYAQRSLARGKRWPAFSRIGSSYFDYFGEGEPGAFAEHRNTMHFTGDSRPTWPMLDFQTRLTTAEGAIGLPYVSHDIGSFKGRHLADDMYVRWIQFGALQPINRLHSDHGDRLPWEYPGKAQRVATEFLRLRGRLVPFLYTLARRSHDTGVPMARAMYMSWPGFDDAYRHDRQYTLGSHVLVAPVAAAGDPAQKSVWFPPGTWVDFFTGERHRGPRIERLSVPLERMPLFVRTGAVLPTQEYRPHETERAPDPLVLTAWAGRDGGFRLYEDRGDGLEYRRRSFAFTRVLHDHRGRRGTVVTIGRARGRYRGRPTRRRYELRVVGARRPRRVTVAGRRLRRVRAGSAKGWWYARGTRTVVVRTGRLRTSRRARIRLMPKTARSRRPSRPRPTGRRP
jgi:hypothetical protein